MINRANNMDILECICYSLTQLYYSDIDILDAYDDKYAEALCLVTLATKIAKEYNINLKHVSWFDDTLMQAILCSKNMTEAQIYIAKHN